MLSLHVSLYISIIRSQDDYILICTYVATIFNVHCCYSYNSQCTIYSYACKVQGMIMYSQPNFPRKSNFWNKKFWIDSMHSCTATCLVNF